MFLFTTPAQQPAASGDVRPALQYASERTGVTFDYLLSTAQRESNLEATAQAGTSSARGLFQFIESTWLSVLRQSGPALGYAEYADQIGSDRSGRAVVTDATARARILELRDDPQASALMAGALARQNGEAMEGQLGRKPTQGELYVAHFLGAKGAVDLISLAASDPSAKAADAFPQAARANRAIFYERNGAARSAIDVYGHLTTLPDAKGQAAQAGAPEAPVQRSHDDAASGMFRAKSDPGRPFHGMFSDMGRGVGPIAGAVAALWQANDEAISRPADPAAKASEIFAAPAARRPAAPAVLAAADGRPLDITPAAAEDAARSYERPAERPARIMR